MSGPLPPAAAPPPSPDDVRLLPMLEAISRSLAGALTVSEAIAEITDAARSLLQFERIAVLRAEGEGVLRVHAAAHGVAWTEGRLLRREECSPRLWVEPFRVDRIEDTTLELDPSFPMDREIIERGTRSVLRVPLIARSGPIGLLAFSNAAPRAFHEDDAQTAGAIAGLVTLALEHERLLAEAVRRRGRLAALDAILPQIERGGDLDDIAAVLTLLTRELIPHDAITVGVLHEGGGRLHSIVDGDQRVTVNPPREFLERQIAPVREGGYLRVQDIEILDESQKLLRFQFARGEERFHLDIAVEEEIWSVRTRVGIRSQLRVAVRGGEGVHGVIAFNSRRPAAFDEEDAILARRIGERISLRLAHERLTDERRRASEAAGRALALEERVESLQRELEAARGAHAVVGTSKSWREVLAQATRVAATDTTVLLTGESGTGKEVVARLLHHASPRGAGPFIAINCAALPEQLLEAELFGHEKGAFTGATAARAGRVEQAAGGVLFLDEVGEMSPSVQAKFLRVLQEREFQRIGGSRVLKADVRVVAATNRDLRAAIRTGDFREDLFYRLHVFAIHLPPLRERPEDILALADHFLRELGATLGRMSPGMTAEARDAMTRYSWPGNARELRNVIERALILGDGGLVHPSHLAFAPASSAMSGAPDEGAAGGANGDAVALETLADRPLPESGVDLEALERTLVRRALAQAAGNKSKAAKLLGLTRAQLYSRLEKFGI